jgi:hypothetical protein
MRLTVEGKPCDSPFFLVGVPLFFVARRRREREWVGQVIYYNKSMRV